MDLKSTDLQMFAAIGVDTATLELAQVRRVTHDEARDVCGVRYKSTHLEGIAFPYLDPETDQPCTWRVRRDHPDQESDGTPIAKYVSPPDRKHVYFGPSCYPQLADVSASAFFVEAEKSLLSLMCPKSAPIGREGCTSRWAAAGASVA